MKVANRERGVICTYGSSLGLGKADHSSLADFNSETR